jgi:hypothetical protein
MSVHRITDAAEAALQHVARREGKKPSEVLSELIIDYLKGLEFDRPDDEPDADDIRDDDPHEAY